MKKNRPLTKKEVEELPLGYNITGSLPNRRERHLLINNPSSTLKDKEKFKLVQRVGRKLIIHKPLSWLEQVKRIINSKNNNPIKKHGISPITN